MTGVSKGMDAYWRYEKFLRKHESVSGSMLGATGAIYAIRHRLYSELPMDVLVDDMYIPLAIVRKGYRAVFDPEAKAYDLPSQKGREELKRKVRTLAGNYQIFRSFPDLFVPLKSPVAWQFFSHKFLRLMVPYLLVILFLLNAAMLGHFFYGMLFILQIAFYALAGTEWLLARFGYRRKGLGYLPYMFCLLNYSALMGLVRYLQKEKRAAWEKAYG